MQGRMLVLGLAMAYLAQGTFAVNVGDENYSTETNGKFYVFADSAIHILNPGSRTIDATITTDASGNVLNATSGRTNVSRLWNDAIYLQNSGGRFVIVNEGDTYTESNSSAYGYTSIVDVVLRRVVGRVKVGARSTHIYGVNRTGIAWIHSDAEGEFYILNITNSDPFRYNSSTVRAYDQNPGHGKLIINDALYPLAYGTNVAEPVIQKFNIANNTRIASFNFSSSIKNTSICQGTHSAWYSRVNKHVYFECSPGRGVLEWNSFKDTFVAHHLVNGTITATPGDDRIFVTWTADRISTELSPGLNGEPSKIVRVISVASQPGDPVFYSNRSSANPGPYSEYTAFFPTARNTNLNNILTVGNGNVQTADYYTAPTDCTYQSGTVSASSVGSSSTAQGLRLAANSNQTCGACAKGIADRDPSQFNATLAGFRIYELATADTTAILASAGAVAPAASAATTANQCSFAAPSRAAKRGGPYVATVADFPQPSVYFLLGSIPLGGGSQSEFFIGTNPRPRKIVWVPNSVSNATTLTSSVSG